ncbi:hypothetical protein BDZ89DRAFT_884806, partial [Hymenopellis radicata]
MLNVAVQYKRAVREITMESPELTAFQLSAVEWSTLEQLRDVLAAFKDATMFFSQVDATLATVIPAMDKMDRMLATAVIKWRTGDLELSASIKAALLIAKRTLNRYYMLTDDSNLYRIAMILHSRYKMWYFDDQNWLPEW